MEEAMQMQMRRSAVTLIELLVVMSIIVMLAAITTPVLLSSLERDQVPKAAGLIQGSLVQAKMRALRDRAGVGIRLLRRSNNPFLADGTTPNPDFFLVDQLEFIQDPGDFTDAWVWADISNVGTAQPHFDSTTTAWVPASTPAAPSGTTLASVVHGPYSTDWTDASTTPASHAAQRAAFTFLNSVLPGDLIEFNGGGQLYQVAPGGVLPADGTVTPRLPWRLVLSRPLTSSIPVPTSLQSNYRIIRQPRPIPAEKPIALPTNVVIDLRTLSPGPDQYYVPGATADPNVPTDILFGTSGRVMRGAPASGNIYLWVRDTSQARLDSQALLVIYPSSGKIATFPVDRDPAHNDPYYLAKKGVAEGGL